MTRRSHTSFFVLVAITRSACTDEALSPVQPGTYEVTRRTEQDTGADRPPAPGATFTVTLTSDALTLASTDVQLPSLEIPGSGSSFHILRYSAAPTNCEAGPNKTCRYSSTEVTVTGHASNTIQIETCTAQKINTLSCSPSPSCTIDDAAATLGSHPCGVDGVVEGDLVK